MSLYDQSLFDNGIESKAINYTLKAYLTLEQSPKLSSFGNVLATNKKKNWLDL